MALSPSTRSYSTDFALYRHRYNTVQFGVQTCAKVRRCDLVPSKHGGSHVQ